MIEINEISKGFSISFHLYKTDLKNLEDILDSLKKFKFTEKGKKGIIELRKGKNYFEFDYNILTPKEIEIFENGKNILKKVLFSRISKCYIGIGYIIILGGTKISNKVLSDLKNITYLEFERKILKNDEIDKIYNKFQKINHLKISNEVDPFIRDVSLRGDLTDKDNWKDFQSDNTEIIEISGIFDTPFGPISLRINYDCSGQLYKGKIIIHEDLIFWLKEILF